MHICERLSKILDISHNTQGLLRKYLEELVGIEIKQCLHIPLMLYVGALLDKVEKYAKVWDSSLGKKALKLYSEIKRLLKTFGYPFDDKVVEFERKIEDLMIKVKKSLYFDRNSTIALLSSFLTIYSFFLTKPSTVSVLLLFITFFLLVYSGITVSRDYFLKDNIIRDIKGVLKSFEDIINPREWYENKKRIRELLKVYQDRWLPREGSLSFILQNS